MRHGLIQLLSGYGPHRHGHTQGHLAGTGPHRRPGSEHGSAAVAHAAGKDIYFTVVSLVGIQGAAGQPKFPGEHGVEIALQPADQVGRDADVGHGELSGQVSPLPQQVARLGEGKGDGLRRLHRAAQHPSGVGLHAAGDVHRHHRHGTGIHHLHGGIGVTPQLGVETDTEEGVHHQVAAQTPGGKVRRGRKVLQPAAHCLQMGLHLPAVGGHLVPAAYQETADLHAGLQQLPCGGHAVAAVVAGAAEHGHPPLLLTRQPRQAALCHCGGGPVHQLERRDAPLLDGGPVQSAHLLRCRDLHGSIPPKSLAQTSFVPLPVRPGRKHWKPMIRGCEGGSPAALLHTPPSFFFALNCPPL